MRSIRTTVPLTVFFCVLWFSSAAAEGLATLNIDISPGKWKSVRLKDLPKDVNVAVQVVSNGEIVVVFVDTKNYQRFSGSPRPLFAGRVEKQLAFSISIPEKGDYFVVLDNRSGQETRAAKVTVRAAPAGASQKKSAEETLANFERQLLQIFVFKPFPIGTRKCGAPRPFADAPGILLCEEYVHHLYGTIKDKEKTQDALSFSIFYEVARVLLAQWNHPSAAGEEMTDEFATVLMILLNQKNRVISTAEYFIKNPSVPEMLLKLFGDGQHPLSGPRAQNILSLVKDPQLARKWQKVLVPHMQTALLKRLQKQPTSWTDLPLVEKELAERSSSKKITI